MATAALSATSCSQFCFIHSTNSAASQRFVSSGNSVTSSSHSTSPRQVPCRNHDNCHNFLFRRSQICGERIYHSPQVSCHFSSHSRSLCTAYFRRDAAFTRRQICGLGLSGNQLPSTGAGMMTTSLETHRFTRVTCRGAAAAVAEIVTLKPFLDKFMLLGTVMYYYITGVSALPRLPELAPEGKRTSSAAPKVSAPTQKRVKKKSVQQQQKSHEQVSYEDTWLALDSKLCKALSQDDSEVEEKYSSNPVLSLQAFARSPRLYLLYTTLHHLRKEVEDIAEADQDMGLSEWRDLSLGVLGRAVCPVFHNWMSQDFSVMNRSFDVAKGVQVAGRNTAGERAENFSLTQSQVLDNLADFFKDTQSIRTYMVSSGKAELYADLIFFLRFGSIRTGGCCDYRSFSKFAGKALEDMVVVVAEVAATLFLDSCSSVATLSPQSETWQSFLLPSVLSTRSLERFRNEVALNGWLNQNFASVVAMFEDRFDLWTFQRQPIPSADIKQVKGMSPENRKKAVESPELVITRVQLPARRSDELKALTGWRYYYSLYLEFSDVVGPILGMLLTRLGDIVSFLLARLIGRSLGLVYQGIRQSVRWSPK